MLNHIALHCVPMHIGWYFDKRDQRCVRTFMKRPVKLPAQFERSTSLSDTLPVSARRRSGRDTDERERVQRPDIVKRLSLARRGGSPFYARSVLKALFGAGA